MRMIYSLPLLVSLLAVSSLAKGEILKFIKKRKIVVIDDNDVSKRDKVCFFAGSKKRACGRVIKVKEDKSYVKIKKKKHFRRIKKDMSYEISSADGSSRSSGGGGLKLRVLLTPSLYARSSFNYVEWKNKSASDKNNDDNDNTDNTDESDNSSSKNFGAIEADRIKAEEEAADGLETLTMRLARYFPWTSFGVEGELDITDSLSVALGGRYTYFHLSPQVDFNFKDNGELDPFMRSGYGGREISFWLDCSCVDVSVVKLGGGVGFTMSKIDILTNKAKKENKDDEEGKIVEEDGKDFVYFKGSSSVNVMSFRLLVRKDLSMGAYGFGFGLTAIISPFSFGSEFTMDEVHNELAKEYDGNEDERKKKVVDDISNALEHQHKLFSLMLSISIYLGI